MTSASSQRSRPKPSALKQKVRAAARNEAATSILDAAERAFAAEGIAGAAMQSIAQRAGTSVGTLYNYFADKDALVRALFEDRHKRLAESIDAALTAHERHDFSTRLDVIVRAVLEHFDTHRAFLKVALVSDTVPLLKKRSAMMVLRTRFDDVVKAGVKEGVLDAKRARLASAALSGTLRALLLDGIDDDARKFEAQVDDVVALFLHGAARHG